MKTRHIFSGILMLLGLGAVLSSCQEQPIFETSSVVVFSANTGYDNGIGTRTSYSGSDFAEETATYERIDWVENDRIRIQSPQARTAAGAEYADYKVVGSTPDGRYSNAEIAQITETSNGLEWASGLNYFYALYPAPSTDGLENPITFTGRDFICTIPAVQTLTQNAVTGIWEPNMNDAYMWAAAKAQQSDGVVQLDFQPAVTAFQFTVGSAESAAMTLYSFELSSTSKALTGRMTAQINNDLTSCTYVCPDRTADNSKITVNFNGTQGIVIPAGESLSFTVFAMPQELTDLTAKFNMDIGSRSLKLNENNVPCTFNATKKYRISNVKVPGGWTYNLGAINDITLSGNELLSGGSRTLAVSSTRSSGSYTNLPAKWKAYVKIGDVLYDHDSSNWPSWLTLSKYSSDGGSENVTLTVSPNELANPHVEDLYGNDMMQKLSGDEVGTPTVPRDLSLYDIYGNRHPGGKVTSINTSGSHTANCYVISAPGYYCLPLVYGNAIKNGAANTQAYSGFKNANGNNISSPYIINDMGNVAYEAVVIWQDVLPTFEMIREPMEVIDAPSGAGLSCKYIKFHIDKKYILPGNILIALRKVSDKTIVWSWHLWVTATDEEDFEIKNLTYRTAFNTTSTSTLKMLNCNVGWAPPMKYISGQTVPRNIQVIIKQEDTGGLEEPFGVSQPSTSTSPYEGLYYSSTYYQWGRKDPFLPGSGRDNGDNKCVSPGEGYTVTTGSNTLPYDQMNHNVANWIKRPYVFESQHQGTQNYNYWDYKMTGFIVNRTDLPTTASVGKTIYDPCPAGFSVPPGRAFTGFTSNGWDTTGTSTTGTRYGSKVAPDGSGRPKGYKFTYNATNNTSTYTLYFPATAGRGQGVGDNHTTGLTKLDPYTYGSSYTAVGYNGYNRWHFIFDYNNTWVKPLELTIDRGAYPVRPVMEW